MEQKLTEKELEVLGYMAIGVKSKEIAGIMKLSPRTIELHQNKIRARMDAKTLYEAMYKFGLLSAKKESIY